MAEKHLNVGFALDVDYIVPTSVACLSAMLSSTMPLTVWVFSADGKTRLTSGVHLYAESHGHQLYYRQALLPLSYAELPKLKFHAHVPTSAWLRFSIFDAEELNGEPIFYLDGDTLVLGPLDGLKTDLFGGMSVMACVDPWNPTASSPKGIQAWKELRLPADAPNFNAGVMWIDTAKWQHERSTEKIARSVRELGDHMWLGDQEAINSALAGEIGILPAVYNVVAKWVAVGANPSSRSPLLHPEGTPIVRHFAGWRKPWLQEWENQPNAAEWLHVRSLLAKSDG